MAQRRMFSKTITSSSRFLMMPLSSQALYFHLGMNADDDGFCEHFTVMRMTESKPDDLRILQAKNLVHVFDDQVLVIMDWKENNSIRADRYTQSRYLEQYKADLKAISETKVNDNQRLPECQPDDNQRLPQVRIGKDRKGKDREGKVNAASAAADNVEYSEHLQIKAYYNGKLLQTGLSQQDINKCIFEEPKERKHYHAMIKRLDPDSYKQFLDYAFKDAFIQKNGCLPSIIVSQYAKLYAAQKAGKTSTARDYSVNADEFNDMYGGIK